MLANYPIIDADSHVFEPNEMWQQYLESEFQVFAPSPDMKVAGEKIYHKISAQVRHQGAQQIVKSHPASVLSRFSPESHVKAMDVMGIDIAFIYPTISMWILGMDGIKPKVAGAFVRAYNNWLQDYCSYNPQRMRGVGTINLHQPSEMISELHRIVDFGWKAVVLRPNPIKGRLLSHPDYEPFWTECEKLNIAVGLHEAPHGRLPTAGADRFHTRFAMHACSHPMEQMMALLALIEGGVLERHPQLKIGLLESGCGWLPYWLWRLDEEYENLYWEVKEQVKMKPSEYFQRQCFIAVEPSEPYLSQIIDYIGSDNLIFGSDYPHMDHKPDILEQAVGLEKSLSTATVKKLLWDNPARFYGLAN